MKEYSFLVFSGYLLGLSVVAEAQDLPALDCLIEPHMVVDISSSVEGTIKSIEVDKSDSVKKGEPLIQLDDAVEKATVNLARAKARMSGEIKARQAAFDFGRRNHKRIDELYAKKAVPFHQKDEAQTDAVLAELELQQAQENNLIAKLELRRATEVLQRRTMKSPIDGVVVERFKSPGEFVEEDPILRVAQIDPLKVELIAPAAFFGIIKKGMKAQVMPEKPMDQALEATVTVVDRVVDASSGTFGIRLELPNPDHRLPGGLKCQVRFDALVFPAPANSGDLSAPLATAGAAGR